jgi:hypothetical protein
MNEFNKSNINQVNKDNEKLIKSLKDAGYEVSMLPLAKRKNNNGCYGSDVYNKPAEDSSKSTKFNYICSTCGCEFEDAKKKKKSICKKCRKIRRENRNQTNG